MNINADYCFHSVGQGLFYTGILNIYNQKKRSVFSFVYDCGSESNTKFLYNSIDLYKVLLPDNVSIGKKHIDLLVVSHLHNDHINGIKYLLNNVDVDTVVLPYMGIDELLLARIDNETNDDFLNEFYIDPIAWFVNQGVNTICLVGSENIMEQSRDKSLIQFENSTMYIRSGDLIGHERNGNTSILYLRKSAKINFYRICWEFEFENLQKDSNKISEMMRLVNSFIDDRYISISDIFKNPPILKMLRNQMREIHSNINRTSVVMCHHPIDLFFDDNRQEYHILTGDLELKKEERISIIDKVVTSKDKVPEYKIILQLPHHGAKNSNIDYFINLDACYCVISYGITNQYGHPNIHYSKMNEMSIRQANEAVSFGASVFYTEK